MTVINTAKRILVPAGLALCMATLVTACNCTKSKAQAQTTPATVKEPSGAEMTGTEMQAANIPLYQETLQVSKQSVDSGQVRLHKVIVTEKTSQPIELRRETLEIVREPAGATTMSSSQESKAFEPQDIVIRLRGEEPVLSKQIVQSGTIVAKKNSSVEQRTVTGDVRKEDIQVDKSGSAANVTFQGGQINEAAGAQSGPAKSSDQQHQQQGEQQKHQQLQEDQDTNNQ